MDLTRIILGPIITEKSERQKLERTYVLKVVPEATKVDVKTALERYYDVTVDSVRVLRTRPKRRMIAAGRSLTKRKAMKKAIVTLGVKSKGLDLVQFKTAA